MPTLRATTFKDSQRSFLEALERHGIHYDRHIQLSDAAMASGISIEIVITGGWGVLAVACLAWAQVRRSRKINVITKDNQTLWLEGYSADEAAKILGAARHISAIDTKPEHEES